MSPLTYAPGAMTLLVDGKPLDGLEISGLTIEDEPAPPPTIEEGLARGKEIAFSSTIVLDREGLAQFRGVIDSVWKAPSPPKHEVSIDGEPWISDGFTQEDNVVRTRLRPHTFLEMVEAPILTTGMIRRAVESHGAPHWMLDRVEAHPQFPLVMLEDPGLDAVWKEARSNARWMAEHQAQERARRQREAARIWGKRRCPDRERKAKRRAQRLARREQR